jgi:hypothetical protein
MAKDASPADLSRLTSASAHSMGRDQGDGEPASQGAKANAADRRWEVSCSIEEEIMPREEPPNQGMEDWTEAMRPIRHPQAA